MEISRRVPPHLPLEAGSRFTSGEESRRQEAARAKRPREAKEPKRLEWNLSGADKWTLHLTGIDEWWAHQHACKARFS
jgi:hypothetical protein